MTFDFRNKVVIITGSTRGIGYATALLFLKSGANVVINSRHQEDINRVLKNLKNNDHCRVLGVKADVSKLKDVEQMVKKVLTKFGTIDILVNNAGQREYQKIEFMSDRSWQRILDINLKGSFLCCQKVIPIMKKNRQGKIINIASEAGKVGSPFSGIHYSASKGGMIALTKCLAKELAPFKINVNAVAPGVIKTDFIPKKKVISEEELKAMILWGELGKPEDVAYLILYLASPEAAYITGQAFSINGGLYTNYQ